MNKKIVLMLMALSSAITQVSAVSIQELVDQKRMPKMSGPRFRRVLNLSNRNIDSLEGLENIPGIEAVHVLRLANNKIETIPSGAFAKALKLRGLGLANNGITSIEPNAFAGLKNLRVLVLNANNISSVPEEGLNGMPRLKLLSIGNNPIITSRRFTPELRKQVPTAYIFTLPITKENLKKVGIAAASVIAVALTVAGAYIQKKSVRPGEEGRNMTAEANLLREAKRLQSLYTSACKSTTPLSEKDRLELSGQFTLVVSLRDALRDTVPVPRINDLVGQVQAYLNSNTCETGQPLDIPAEEMPVVDATPLDMKRAVLMIRKGIVPMDQIDAFKRFVDAAEARYVLAPDPNGDIITYNDYKDKYDELIQRWQGNDELAVFVRNKLDRDIKFIKTMRHWQL